MSVSDHLPYHSVSDDELCCLIYSDLVNINYLSLAVLDTMVFNPLHFQQDEDLNNNADPLFYNPANSTHKSSQYIYLTDHDKQPWANNVLTILSMNIRSFASNLQSYTDQCLNCNYVKLDIMGFSETRLDNNIVPLY